MKTGLNQDSGGTRLVSVVVFSIRNAGRVLLLGPDENGAWKFPSEEFDGKLNGNLESTLRRLSAKFLKSPQLKAKCVKSFVSMMGNTVEVVYNFTMDVREGDVTEPHIWIVPRELIGLELDVRTNAFMKASVRG